MSAFIGTTPLVLTPRMPELTDAFNMTGPNQEQTLCNLIVHTVFNYLSELNVKYTTRSFQMYLFLYQQMWAEPVGCVGGVYQ